MLAFRKDASSEKPVELLGKQAAGQRIKKAIIRNIHQEKKEFEVGVRCVAKGKEESGE